MFRVPFFFLLLINSFIYVCVACVKFMGIRFNFLINNKIIYNVWMFRERNAREIKMGRF